MATALTAASFLGVKNAKALEYPEDVQKMLNNSEEFAGKVGTIWRDCRNADRSVLSSISNTTDQRDLTALYNTHKSLESERLKTEVVVLKTMEGYANLQICFGYIIPTTGSPFPPISQKKACKRFLKSREELLELVTIAGTTRTVDPVYLPKGDLYVRTSGPVHANLPMERKLVKKRIEELKNDIEKLESNTP